MVVVGDIVELLKRWDRWRRIDETPERVDALEKRIAELESRLQRAPGKACPKCGALELRTDKVEPRRDHFGALGAVNRYYKCSACGHTEVHMER
jgi:DNA-directed RNA polymerase subunit RPC12/RpoP